MNLPTLSISRHVLTTMASAVLVLFGIIGYQRLGVDRFPYTEFPLVAVTTNLTGASPEVIDAALTNVIETAVNSVPGIEHIESSSSPGTSSVVVTFNLDKNIDIAFNEVQSKVNQVLRQLPTDADPPVVAKVEFGAQPIMWLALEGDRTLQQLNTYAINTVKKSLETVDGVGEVQIGGKRERTVRVNLDPERMAAFNVTASEVLAAIRNEHFMMAGGFLTSGGREHLVKLDLEYHKVRDLEKLVVAYRDSAPLHLADIANVIDGLEDRRSAAKFNGRESVGLGIVKVSDANTVAIVDEVYRRIETVINPQLPPGLKLSVSSDDSIFVRELVTALQEHLLLGTLLTALVVWLFLKNIRSTLIIAVAIPVSLLGSVALIYFMGYTLNSMTLLALLLLIGIVVDDAIVVLENIYRHREGLDPDPRSAAINGTREVVFAVLAATLSLVSIFVPVIFMGGIIGRFFESFAVVVAAGVLVSWFVSMTLTPMLCSRFLEVEEHHKGLYYWLERSFRAMESAYAKLLALALSWRWTVIGLTWLSVLGCGFFLKDIGKEFSPEQDESRFMVMVRAPLGSGIDYMLGKVDEVEAVLARHNDVVQSFFIGVGTSGRQMNEAWGFARMIPKEERATSQQDLLKTLGAEFAAIPGVRAFPIPIPSLGGTRGEPLQFVIRGTNLIEVGRLAQELQQRLLAEPGFGYVDLDLNLELPQFKLNIDRVRAADLGFSAQDVATAVNVMIGGVDAAKYNDDPGDGERYDLRLKGGDAAFRNHADLSKIYLRSREGQMIRIDTVATLDEALGPASIPRYDLRYSAPFYAKPEIPLATAIAKVREHADAILTPGYNLTFKGQSEEFAKTANNMLFAFVLATGLLYMVLASQFNSFLQPLIIMTAQPLAMVGGIAALWLTGQTLNTYSMIGLVLLIGLVAKNAILLVDITNQRREQGLGVDAALLAACPIRLRPVLMTSLTVILAMVPAALGVGAGSETNGPLAIAVIGGMLSSTLLTLVVIPPVYSILEGFLEWWQARRAIA
ncbi:MAG: efflux RND transporter permease subunit [Gammaproteobacteria bacterium]|nr:efflux RND transporter permease subunit [Gammaproteobacteria bacterium]